MDRDQHPAARGQPLSGETPARILVIEDSDDDFVLVQNGLREAGIHPVTLTRVDGEEELKEALANGGWDLVLSDYTLPSFTAPRAFKIVRDADPFLPFIIVSGSIGEERAVEALKQGVSNYVLKDNLYRLGPTILRELEDARLRRERAEAVAEAERALKARDEFLSMAAHELKTPLASLQLQAESLLAAATDEHFRVSERQTLERLQALVAHARRLTRSIDRILDISQVSEGRLDLLRREMDAVEITRDLLAHLADVLAESGSTVTLNAPEMLVGEWDPDRFQTILTNLLTNAAKYGAGKPITVTLRDDGGLLLEVRDRGIGIAPEDQRRIFQRFERAVPGRRYSGFGVGLWLVCQIVEAHGGKIRVESGLGEGSTFIVTLPRVAAGTRVVAKR